MQNPACLGGLMTRCEHSPGIFRKNLTSANRCRKSRRNKSNHSEATVQTFKNLFLAALAATVLATPAAAGPDRVWISLGSAHISDRDFEQFNPGVFLTWEGERLGYTVGAFRNSYGEFSTAATIGVALMRQEDYELSLFAGAATYPGFADRFRYSSGDVVAIAGANFRYKNAYVQAFPGNGESVQLTLSFGLTFGL